MSEDDDLELETEEECSSTPFDDDSLFIVEQQWPAQVQAAYLLIKARHIDNHESLPAPLMTAAAYALQRWFEVFTEFIEMVAPTEEADDANTTDE